MFKKLFFTLTSFGLLAGSLTAQLPNPLPEEFTVLQRWFSWTSDFDIETKEYKLGHIHRKFMSWTVEYEFYDVYEQLEARAKARWFTWGATFDVTDALEEPLGTVEERIFTFFPTFDIISPIGQKLATAKMNFWGTRYTLTDPVTNLPMATLYRPFFRWKDDWTVTIVNPVLFNQKQMDPRLFIIVMAFQSDREMWERQRRATDDLIDAIFNPNYSVQRLSAAAKTKAPVENDHSEGLKSLREQLDAHRDTLANVEPSETDFNTVEEIVEATLKAAENTQSEEEQTELQKSENARLVLGLQNIMPLLSSDKLSSGQKSALFLIIEHYLTK